jgi:glycosyltransferase involved in cell wall biosynthesis
MDKVFKKIRPLHEYIREHSVWLAHIMFLFEEKMNTTVNYFYLKKRSDVSCVKKLSRNAIWIFCVAFNNPPLIEKQIELFQKNSDENTILIIADNSSDTKKRTTIQHICEKGNVRYINLPKNPRTQPSLNHGLALNWLYYNVIKKEHPWAFGFIDHDIFPTRTIDIAGKLNDHDAYGLKIERKNGALSAWYLWPGFCFYQGNYFNNVKPNFSCVIISRWNGYVGLDTGGGNFEKIYKNNPGTILFATKKTSANGSEIIDDWFHVAKASFKKPEELYDIMTAL